VAAYVRDCRDPPQHSTIESRALFLVLGAEAGRGRGKLVVYEDLAEDLRWNAAASRECIMAAADHAERPGVDSRHLFVYEVQRLSVAQLRVEDETRCMMSSTN